MRLPSPATAIALLVAERVFGAVQARDWVTIVVGGLVLAVVNMLVRPVVTVLAIPAIVLTLGLAYLLVNVAMVALAAWLVPSLDIGGFWDVVWAAIIIWLVNVFLQVIPGPWRAEKRRRRGRQV